MNSILSKTALSVNLFLRYRVFASIDVKIGVSAKIV